MFESKGQISSGKNVKNNYCKQQQMLYIYY